jgi:glutathione S-transferase/GST-like protein
MIELYHWEPTAESLALLVCLKEKEVEFQSHYVDMLQLEQHTAAYLELSPKARVPLLVAEGEAMSDAGFALQYLAERYPQPRLAPSDASGWYDLQAWTAWLGGMGGLAADVQLLGWNHVMLEKMPAKELAAFRAKVVLLPQEKKSGWAAVWSDAEADEDQLANAEERVQELVTRIESNLSASTWMLGDEYSIIDVSTYAHMHSLPELLPAIVNDRQSPKVVEWLARITKRPAVLDALKMNKSTIAPVVYSAPGS